MCCEPVCCCCDPSKPRKVPINIHDTVECIGTTLTHNTVNLWYWLIFRFIACLGVITILIWSFAEYVIIDETILWFTYITHWGLIFNVTYMIATAILSYKVYNGIKNKTGGSVSIEDIKLYPSINDLGLQKHWDFVLFVLNSSLSWSIFVILLFYSLLFDPNDFQIISFFTHGVAGGLVLIEWFTSCWQISYNGAIYVLGFALAWITLSIFYFIGGCRNEYDNGRYIYDVIDWSSGNIGGTIGYCVFICGGLVLSHCFLVFIKNEILKCWLNTRTAEERETLIVTTSSNGSNGQTTNVEFANV